MNSFYALLIAYVIAGTALAIYSRKYGFKTHEEYFIAGRNVSGIISALTYAATTYSAFMMVGLVGLSYATGVGAAAFELFYLVGTLFLLSYFAPKMWRFARDNGVVTPAEMLSKKYGKSEGILASIIPVVALIPYTSAQIIGVSLILEKTVGLSFHNALIIAVFLIAFWALIGGLRGVAWTDAVQGVIMLLAGFVALALALTFVNGNVLEESSSLGSLLQVPNKIWTAERFIALTVPWFFFALTNPQVVQRVFIPKSEKDLKKMVVFFGLFGLIYTFIVTFMGITLKIATIQGNFPEISYRDDVTPVFITKIPEFAGLILALSILAAAITTANSIILSLASMISRDILKEEGVFYGKIFVVILSVIVGIFAYFRFSYIVELSVMSSAILLCLLPATIGVFSERIKRARASIVAGFISAIILKFAGVMLYGVYTLIISLLVLAAENIKK